MESIDWTGFDIPETRKDVSNKSNARWILRNLSINNKKHPRLSAVLGLAKQVIKA